MADRGFASMTRFESLSPMAMATTRHALIIPQAH
ncbi:hypothetical protein L686_02550 [Stutzerimonas stutzeri MF28]|nr:hypothetical protein L686_02550 [Stutzerimonas stutzeri MF28]